MYLEPRGFVLSLANLTFHEHLPLFGKSSPGLRCSSNRENRDKDHTDKKNILDNKIVVRQIKKKISTHWHRIFTGNIFFFWKHFTMKRTWAFFKQIFRRFQNVSVIGKKRESECCFFFCTKITQIFSELLFL